MTRFVNTSLLVLMSLLGLSGVVMLYGTWQPWMFGLHRMLGFSLLALAPLKSIVIYHSLQRGFGRSFDRRGAILASLGLLALVLAVIAFGLLWVWRLGPESILLQSLISWHWIGGLLLAPLFLFHIWRRWPNPRPADVLSRRSVLKLGGAAAFGVLGGWLADRSASALTAHRGVRRFTGSRQDGSFAGNAFPLTGEAAPSIDLDTWRLELTGREGAASKLSYTELLARADYRQVETIDCTNGWYSTQGWRGVRLIDLLSEAGLDGKLAGVRLVSATGYHHTYPLAEAETILLATHVGEEPISAEHGFPLRAVVPGRRGWFWVKWLVCVDALYNPADVAAGILASPRETLRQWQ